MDVARQEIGSRAVGDKSRDRWNRRAEASSVADDPDAVVRALARASLLTGAAGLVLGLPGNASLPASWEAAIEADLPPSVPLVLASRCGAGVRPVHGERANNWLQSTTLDPLKARVRLIAGLGAGLRGVRLKRWFERG